MTLPNNSETFRLSYDVEIFANVNGIEKTNKFDLKNPNFRYMSGGVQMASVNYYESTATNVQNTEQPPAVDTNCRF